MKRFTFDDRWDAIKAQLKQRYAQLTDDDLMFAEGKGEEMLSRVREKLDISMKDLKSVLDDLHDGTDGLLGKAKAKVGEWTDDLREKAGKVAGDVKERAAAAAEEAKAQASAAYDQARQRALTLRDDGMQYVRQNPRTSLVTAVCAGFVAGLLIRR